MANGGSTKQLKRVLGFGDLMGAAVGQIIGAGIMTLLGSAMLMTGRSVPLALLISAIITICQCLPLIFISGTVRVRGGRYTTVAMLAGKKIAGAQTIIFIFSNLSLSMYALSFASYFVSLLGLGNEKVVALIILTLFFLLNILGIDKFAKAQNIIVTCLVVALGLFVVLGVPKVDFSTYYGNDTFMTGEMIGLFQAGGLLTFATGGASAILNLSAEAKNPTRDIPVVMIIATLFVAVLYAAIAVVAAGVLPLDVVAGKNLSLVAEHIFNRPLYVFFMVCGAGFALISTLNAQFAWAPKPTMQACDDGWLPSGLVKLTKWNTPVIILGILYAIAVVCIITGLSISILGSMSVIATGIMSFVINASVWRLPQVVPEEWSVSRFKVSNGMLKVISVIAAVSSVFNIYLNASRLTSNLLILNVVVITGAFIFGVIRSKKAHVEISYEKT